ncbi:MAG: 50S ribosomal protein L6 [Caldicoprobacterales bacterium]|jgi:large subunit ribosomal protein L6|nr:50S ribosomal protein L6 [Clostridiales bacterium]
MSRIGKLPVEIPNGVTVTVNDGNVVSVKGPKGELTQKIHTDMQVILEGNILKVERPSNSKHHRSLHGLSRSLLNNMIEGVTKGYEKSLEISGVGYRAQKQGKKLVLTVGYSHPVEIPEEDGIEFDVPAPNKIVVKGIDKQKVGAMAAKVRAVREPEPYKGKGIKYENERIYRKEGKTAN